MEQNEAILNCRYFNGYKPCGKSDNCDQSCRFKSIVRQRVLIIHLGALGAVVRSTGLLRAIHRRFPESYITWVTDAPAQSLLINNPLIDRVLTTSTSDLLQLKALRFDIVLNIDKSIKASGVAKSTNYDLLLGFIADEKTGAILPANSEAHELWEIGLSNNKKFFQNTKTELQLTHESLCLGPYQRDDYYLPLMPQELEQARLRKNLWKKKSSPVIGFNTGCSPTIPYKKWTLDFHRVVIKELLNQGFENIVLLGGPEDTHRNIQIAKDLPVVISDSNSGLRDGLISMQACDIVITGDSLGMHMAIARKKYVVAWFGPTCDQEIDLFDRGVKILSHSSCSPCWKRECNKNVMCYDQIDLQDILSAVKKGNQWSQSFSFKQHSLEI
jgi:heptosyltransferase-2